MRERSGRADVPAIREHQRGRGVGTVLLVTACALLLAGAVTGWTLIGGDGQGSAASLGSAGPVQLQQRADGPQTAGGEGERTSARLPVPPIPVVLPPTAEAEPTPSSDARGRDSSRGDQADSPGESDPFDGSDQHDQEPAPEPEAPEPDPGPKPQPRPRVAVLTTEAEYGFAAGVRIRNDGDRPLRWTMRLTYDNVRVTGGWQADIEQNGSQVTIRGIDRTATIPPGEQVIFGYHLTGEVQQPTDCTLNGKPCRLISR